MAAGQKVIVITGASSGIGAALARHLAAPATRLVLCGRRMAALRLVARQCRTAGATVVAVRADVRAAGDVEHLAAVAAQAGHIDIWVNNAGAIMYAPFLSAAESEFRQIIETNLFGVVHGARAALRQFTEQGHGTLINVASGFGALPAPFVAAYAASKAAVRALSLSLYQEYYLSRFADIHICTVLPGTIDTPIYRRAPNAMSRPVRPMPPVYPVDKAVRRIARLIQHPRPEVVVGWPIRWLGALYAILPAFFLRRFARYVFTHNYTGGSS